MKVAFLFPGQGSQRVGMGAELAREFSAAREAFNEADEALGFKLSKLCFEGPEEDLRLTANTQPATLATSIAALRAFTSPSMASRPRLPRATASANTARWSRRVRSSLRRRSVRCASAAA